MEAAGQMWWDTPRSGTAVACIRAGCIIAEVCTVAASTVAASTVAVYIEVVYIEAAYIEAAYIAVDSVAKRQPLRARLPRISTLAKDRLVSMAGNEDRLMAR
jgi:hypothetical protein